MPGRVLVIDPIVTNRVVLKTQLEAKYFTVDVAITLADCRKLFAKTPPDAIVLNYEVEEASGFSTCKTLKTNYRTAHIPVLLLCRHFEDMFWTTALKLGVEEVMPALADSESLGSRLAQMIRRKESFDAQRLRQTAYQAMGFAEDAVLFPPQFPPALGVDCSNAPRLAEPENAAILSALLKSSFPSVALSTAKPVGCQVLVLDEAEFGDENALRNLCALKQRTQGDNQSSKILYLSEDPGTGALKRALELGADDFADNGCSLAELASRIRRLAWVQDFEKAAERKVSDRLKLALRDPMTGLHNRRYALQYLNNILQQSHGDHRSITVMMLDLDHFKTINDEHGHKTGDVVICQVAQALQTGVRNVDLVARFGGEEFLAVLTDTPDRQAMAIAERMRKKIRLLKIQVEGMKNPLDVSVSIGIAVASGNRITATALIDHADQALYKSKDFGRNRVTFSGLAA